MRINNMLFWDVWALGISWSLRLSQVNICIGPYVLQFDYYKPQEE